MLKNEVQLNSRGRFKTRARKYFKQSKGGIAFDIINFTLLLLLAVITIYPMYYILVLSFNDGMDAVKGGIWFFPRVFTFDNYVQAFADNKIIYGFLISIARTVLGTVLSVMLIAMMAFALCDKKLPFRRSLLKYFFFTTIFSGGMIPFAALLRQLNLFDNFLIYILPAIYSFYNMIIMRSSFETIPESLSESAKIDGATTARIFFSLYLPLSVPVAVTIALFTAVFHWNDWFAGLFYVRTQELKPAATILQEIIASSVGSKSDHMSGGGGEITPQSLQMAFVVIIVFPILCVYPFLQRYFVKGVMIGSIKE